MTDRSIAPATPGDVTIIARQFRGALDAKDQDAAYAMQGAYSHIMQGLSDDINAVEQAISARQAAGQPVPVSWLHKEQRYKALIIQATRQFDEYGRVTGQLISRDMQWAAVLAMDNTAALLDAQLPQARSIRGPWNYLPNNVIEQFRGSLDSGSPVAELLRDFGGYAAYEVEKAVTYALATGLPSDQIVGKITDALGVMPYRARLIARTEMYRSFREANRAMFQANEDVLDGWIWFAHLGGSRSCAACLGMHGTLHDVSEPLGAHPGCRCTQIPQTKSWADLGRPELSETRVTPGMLGDADDWLRKQPADVQRATLGTGKRLQRWQDGDFMLRDMVKRNDSDRWGTTYTVANLRATNAASHARQLADEERARLAALPPALPDPVIAVETMPAWLREAKSIRQRMQDDIARGITPTLDDTLALGKSIRKGMADKLPGGYEANAKEFQKLSKRRSALIAKRDNPRTSLAAKAEAEKELRNLGYELNYRRANIGGLSGKDAKRMQTLERQRAKELSRFEDGTMDDLYYNDRDEWDRQYDAWRAKRDKIDAELNIIRAKEGTGQDFDLAAPSLDALKRVRSFGSSTRHRVSDPFEPIDWHGNGQSKRFTPEADAQVMEWIEDSSAVYPSDWWEYSAAKNHIMPGRALRGYQAPPHYPHGFDKPSVTEIVTSGTEEFRSRQTIVHEVAHRMEDAVPGLRSLENAFYRRRTDGEPLESMPWVRPGGQAEVGRLDGFFDLYIGRDYGDSAYEITSMGSEAVLSPYGVSRGGRNILVDTEHLDFMLGVLGGL